MVEVPFAWNVLPKATTPPVVVALLPVGVVAGVVLLLVGVFNILLPIPPGDGSLYLTVLAAVAADPLPYPPVAIQTPPPIVFNFGIEDDGLVRVGVLDFDLVGLSNVVLLLVIPLLLPPKVVPLEPPGGLGVLDKLDDAVDDKLIVMLAFFIANAGLFALLTIGGVGYCSSEDPDGELDFALFNNGISTVLTILAVLNSGNCFFSGSLPLHVLCRDDDCDEDAEPLDESEKFPENFLTFTLCPLVTVPEPEFLVPYAFPKKLLPCVLPVLGLV